MRENSHSRESITGRGGRDEVVARVLAAAEELFSANPFRDVTVRRIAAAAGVSHALVHRYLGSKREILLAVIAREEGEIMTAAQGQQRVKDAAQAMLRADPDRLRRYMMLVIRAVMDGVITEPGPDSFPVARILSDAAARQAAGAGGTAPCAGIDPRFAATTAVALASGWFMLEEPLLKVLDQGDLDRAAIDKQLIRVIGCLLDATVPG